MGFCGGKALIKSVIIVLSGSAELLGKRTEVTALKEKQMQSDERFLERLHRLDCP